MTFFDLIYLVHGNLWRRKTRVLMTIGGVLIGSMAIILLIALGLGMQKNLMESIGNLGDLTTLTVRVPAACTLPLRERPQSCQNVLLNPELVEKIRTSSAVVEASPQVFLKSSPAYLRYKNMESNVVVVGVEPSRLASVGYPLARGEMVITAGKVVIGPKVCEYMFDLRKRQPVQPQLDLLEEWVDLTIQRTVQTNDEVEAPEAGVRRLRVQVIGVLGETGGASDYMIYYPLSEVDRWNRWLTGKNIRREVEGYDQIVIKMADAASAAELDQALTSAGYEVDAPRKVIEQFNRFFVSLQWMLGGIGAVALLISAFGISNTMLMAIYERTREIGLLKSLGAKNSDILALFLAEAGALGLVGGILGALLAVTLCAVVTQGGAGVLSQIDGFVSMPGIGIPGLNGGTTLLVPPWLVFFAVVFTAFTGVFSGIYPAIRAASMQPLDALRHE